MVHNGCEEKRKRDFEIKSLKDNHPITAEFHYIVICSQGRLVRVFFDLSGGFVLFFTLFCCK